MPAATQVGPDARAWAAENLRGFYMCPLTPFTADFQLDEEGLRYNIDAFVEMGCAVPGSSSAGSSPKDGT